MVWLFFTILFIFIVLPEGRLKRNEQRHFFHVNREQRGGPLLCFLNCADLTVSAMNDYNNVSKGKQQFKTQNKPTQDSQPPFLGGQPSCYDFPLFIVLKADNSKFFFSFFHPARARTRPLFTM